jgi:DNA-binding transcriptional ArsR family regulator
MDEKSEKVMRTIAARKRPYKLADVAMATKLSKRVVGRRIVELGRKGLVEEYWVGERGPYYRIATDGETP